MSFTGKTAIVTGAGQGIGYEICSRLVREGAQVILNDIDPGLAINAAQNINNETNGNCIGVGGDCSDINFIRQMVNRAVEEFGKLDIVIANAGITLYGDFFTYSPESFFRVMQVNLG